MATSTELEQVQFQDIRELTVSEDPSDITGRAVLLHNPETGGAIAISASVLANLAATEALVALTRRVQALEDKSFIHLTLVEWQELEESGDIIPGKWYLVYSDETLLTLKRIYIGSELIAQRAESGSVGFPYTFPFNF